MRLRYSAKHAGRLTPQGENGQMIGSVIRRNHRGESSMPAYLISTIEVTDPVAYEEYKKRVTAPLAAHGGKFIVRGGAIEHKEGDWRPKRVVVVEFESMAKAQAFYESADYAPARDIRQRSSVSSVLLVEGV